MLIYNYFNNEELFYLIVHTLFCGVIISAFFCSIRFGITAIKDLKTYLNQEKRKRDAYLYSDILMAACISIVALIWCFVVVMFSDVVVNTTDSINDIYCQSTHQYITVEGDCSINSVRKQYRYRDPAYRVILTIGDVIIKPDNYFSEERYSELCSLKKARICYIIDGEKTSLYDVFDSDSGEYCWTTDSTVLLIFDSD